MVYVCWHIEREREVCLVLFVCETSPPGVDFNFFLLKKSYKNYMWDILIIHRYTDQSSKKICGNPLLKILSIFSL